jgi:hypothetical protein
VQGLALVHAVDCLLELGRGDEAIRIAQTAVDAAASDSELRPLLLAEVAWANWKGARDEAGAKKLLDQIGRYRLRSLTLRGNLQRSVSEHKTILRAARRGDAERAAELMAEHIRVPQRRAMALEEAEST